MALSVDKRAARKNRIWQPDDQLRARLRGDELCPFTFASKIYAPSHKGTHAAIPTPGGRIKLAHRQMRPLALPR
jgi:hypothetical protein